MSKCIKCNQDLKPNEIPAFFDGLCKDCWNKKQYETYPFKKGIADKDQQIAELKQQVKAKDILIDTYMSVVGTLTNAKNIKQQLAEKDKEIKYFESEWKGCQIDLDHYKGECFNLKDQLHTQPKEIVEKIKNFMDENTYYYEEERFAEYIAKYLDKILKEYEEK